MINSKLVNCNKYPSMYNNIKWFTKGMYILKHLNHYHGCLEFESPADGYNNLDATIKIYLLLKLKSVKSHELYI